MVAVHLGHSADLRTCAHHVGASTRCPSVRLSLEERARRKGRAGRLRETENSQRANLVVREDSLWRSGGAVANLELSHAHTGLIT